MAATYPSSDDLPLLEQASSWFDRVSAGEMRADQREAFERWRAEPRHAEAYATVEAGHAFALSAANAPDILSLRHEALSRIVMARSKKRKRAWAGGAIAASIAGALVIAGIGGMPDLGKGSPEIAAVTPTQYQTAVGERLTVSLPDGSSATLNTASKLRLAYTGGERRLILEAGQALFHVARGQKRPFIVEALDRTVTAHGTTFDVRIEPGRKVKVSLLEGVVSVASVRSPKALPTTMRPKDVLIASGSEVQVKAEPQVEQDMSWRDGLIIFEDDSLAEATGEVNRYVRTPIVLSDERLKAIRVSGAFRTGETAAFVEALQLSFPVRVVERSPKGIVLAYRG